MMAQTAVQHVLSDAERAALLAQFEREVRFFLAHEQELLRTHPDKWVAVYGERVVGASLDRDRLLADLRARGIPPEHAFIQRLVTGDEVLIV
jgi:hypothetical protein